MGHRDYISAERKRYDSWQLAATVVKQQLMALYNDGVLPADLVAALFEEFPELRHA